jgi:hypothetical protein
LSESISIFLFHEGKEPDEVQRKKRRKKSSRPSSDVEPGLDASG